MNDHVQPGGPDPDAQADPGPHTVPAAPRRSWRPRRRGSRARPDGSRPRGSAVLTAATSRTAGWMVAAALAGSLATLLLTGRNTAATLVPVRGTAFAGPGGVQVVPGRHPARSWTRVGGPGWQARPPGRRAYIQVPGPGRASAGQAPFAVPPRWLKVRGGRHVIAVPGMVPMQGPGMFPGCQAGRAAGRPAVGWTIIGPGKRQLHVSMVRPPARRSVVVGPGKRNVRIYISVPTAGARRTFCWAAGPGRQPRQIVLRPGRRTIVLGPGCAALSPARTHGQPSGSR